MTIHFAAACTPASSVIARQLTALVPMHAANDNGNRPQGDRLLKAALKHFACHGLSAAERARENAETAFFEGDSESYRWWLAICRSLDRRMADAVAAREPKNHRR